MIDEKPKTDLINIIIESGAFEKKKSWFLINNIWHAPDYRKRFHQALLSIWKREMWGNECKMLICPEGIVSSFGVIPFASLISHDLDYYMAIWKENGDLLTTAPLTYPDRSFLEHNKKCIVFQDVVSKGSTIQKMQKDLSSLNWKIDKYIALIQIEKSRNELNACIEELRIGNNFLSEDFAFIPIIKDIEI